MNSSETKNKAKKQIKLASVFMAYPFWILVQNISFYFMLFFYQRMMSLKYPMFSIKSIMSITSLFFMLAAIISTISAGINLGDFYLDFSLSVLPNYLYWGILIITLGNLGTRVMQTIEYYEMFFWGLVLSIITFYFLKPILIGLPIYRNVTQNNFAFVLICFGPMATAFVYYKYKNVFYTISVIVGITLAGFLSGSRSGSLLTLLGCSLVVSIGSVIRMLVVGFISILLFVASPEIIYSSFVKNYVKSLNERTYELLYSTDETLVTDRSYLTRLAMIEKGINIFEEYPLVGVGIGNFSNTTFEIEFNFEGAEFIEGKEELLETSTNPHNSYVSFLSEGGLLLFIPAIILMFFPLFYFIGNFNSVSPINQAIFISIFFMCIHAWFIAGMVNVYGWFILGLANSVIQNKDETRISLP